jgi:hypothetical protein
MTGKPFADTGGLAIRVHDPAVLPDEQSNA